MKRWAVGFYSLFDSELEIEIVNATSWQEAIAQHSKAKEFSFSLESLEKAKGDFFDADAAIDAKEIV